MKKASHQRTLQEREGAVLQALQFNADDSLDSVAAAADVQTAALHYIIKKYTERGVLRRSAILNYYALGLQEYEVVLSCGGNWRSKDRKVFITALQKSPQITWFAEVGGHYQYSFSVQARNVEEASAFLDKLTLSTEFAIFQKEVVAIVWKQWFRKRYLCPRMRLTPESIRVDHGTALCDVDELDRKILAQVVSADVRSQRDLAAALKVPRATVDYRLRKLRARKIINSDVYLISARRLGYLTYKALLYARGLRPDLEARLLAFAKRNPHVVLFFRTLGSWDFEIGYEVINSEQAREVLFELYETAGDLLHDCKVIQVLTQTVSNAYLRNSNTYSTEHE